MTQRYHKAARDGLLDILKETTRKDCNTGDEDGMTPTLWAAFEGKLEALSLLVGRGGDPNKCDHYGNAALHLASARGHFDCVDFLVKFGVNIFSLDIDMHTSKELAAMNDCPEILRFLDREAANQEVENPKKAKAMQEKAQKDAAKLLKNFKKIQKKADKINNKDIRNLDREIERLGIMNNGESSDDLGIDSNSNSSGSNAAPKFSEITSSSGNGSENSSFSQGTVRIGGKKLIGTVSKKLNLKKSQARLEASAGSGHSAPFENGGGFTISEIEDGKRSVAKHLRGRRASANVLFVPKKLEAPTENPDEETENNFGNGNHDHLIDPGYASERPLFLQNQRKSLAPGLTGGASIFDRPGIGSMAFRNSVSASLFSFNNNNNEANKDNSIGSAGSLAAEEEDIDGEEDDQEADGIIPPFNAAEFAPVAIFLAGLGLGDWIKVFERERIDLEALTLLGDSELRTLGLPLGPRMKMLSAIDERRKAMSDEQILQDSQL